jgi:hypothetical protein
MTIQGVIPSRLILFGLEFFRNTATDDYATFRSPTIPFRAYILYSTKNFELHLDGYIPVHWHLSVCPFEMLRTTDAK